MHRYVECNGCQFVYVPERGAEDPIPKGRDSCPNCGGTDFRFTDE